MAQRKRPLKKQLPPAEILRHQYHDLRMTSSQLGRMYDVDPQTILNWMNRLGIERREACSCPKEMNPSWRGGKTVDKNGYILVFDPEHPNARATGYVLEHRKVMSEFLGRSLLRNDVVHHKNGKKDDNRIENLHLYGSNADHLRDELTGNIPNWTASGIQALRAAVRKPRRNTWTPERRQMQRERLAQRRAAGEKFCAR